MHWLYPSMTDATSRRVAIDFAKVRSHRRHATDAPQKEGLRLSNKEVVGRNDPCPCGSGKKYKYCCLASPMNKRSDLVLQKSYDDDDSIFSPIAAIEYGRADLNSSSIDSRQLHEVSSPRMLYSLLLMPQAEVLASRISNQLLTRARGEAAKIARAGTLQQLLEIMAHRPDPLNHTRLVARVLEFGEEAVREILRRFRVQQNATFLELGIRVLSKSGLDCYDEVCDVVDSGPRRAYQISLLCMLLGFTRDRKYVQRLWNYYHFFRYHFPAAIELQSV